MDFGEALRRTMFEFRITGKRLSEATGINAGQISEFKNGGVSLSVANLQALIQSLDDEPRAYLLSLVGNVNCVPMSHHSAQAAEQPGQYLPNAD
jgi:transcriptional regulator with XRE-family HTH domain